MLRSRDDAKFGNETFYDADVTGVDADLPKITELKIAEGRFLTAFDVERARPLAVIGADIHKQLFGPVDVIGRRSRSEGMPTRSSASKRATGVSSASRWIPASTSLHRLPEEVRVEKVSGRACQSALSRGARGNPG